MTKCSECGQKMTAKKANYLYREDSGLPITLEGIEVLSCAGCGARDPVIPRMLDLHAAIVGLIARKKGRLAGAEIRFIRSAMGLSGRELARLMGATPVSVSRWETSASTPGTHADKLIRLIASVAHGDTAYGVKEVAAAASADGAAEPLRVTLAFGRGGWKVVGEMSSAAAAA